MEKFVIQGGAHLRGELPVSGSKNAALAIMAATVLSSGTSTIYNVPSLRDIRTFGQVLEYTGARISFDSEAHTLRIDSTSIDTPEAPYELVKKMRASFYMLGALLARFGYARVSLPGGCAWGPRPVDLHLKGLEAFGAEIALEQGYVVARAPGGRIRGGYFHLEPSSVGATINLLLAAVTARGYSRIENAAIEPDVVVFGEALQQMGAQIEGLGTRTLEVYGVDTLKPLTFTNVPDRIEAGTFMILSALAGSPDEPVAITHTEPAHLGEAFLEAFEATGTPFEIAGSTIYVTAPEVIQPVSIETAPYPGFPTDLQAQWTVLLTQASGNARIKENIYFDRFKHVPELRRMGANIIVIGNEAFVEGNTALKGAHVMSTDLRASVSLVMAGIIAEGETHVLRIYHLDRGYERLEQKLAAAGIPVERVTYDEWATPEHQPSSESHS